MSKYYLDYTEFSGLSMGAKIGLGGLASLGLGAAGAYGAHRLYEKTHSPQDLIYRGLHKKHMNEAKAKGYKLSREEKNFKKYKNILTEDGLIPSLIDALSL